EKFPRNFHGTCIDTATHGSAPAAGGIIKGASCAGDRIEQNKDILAGLDQTFGALDRQLGNAGMALDIAVVRTRHDFRLGTGAPEIGYFLWALIDQKYDQLHFRMILDDRIRDV